MNDLVDEMIEAVDDGDGEIDYDEFVSMIQKYWNIIMGCINLLNEYFRW